MATSNNEESRFKEPHRKEVVMAKKPKQPRKKGSTEFRGEFAPPFSPREMQKMMAQTMASLLGEELSPEREAAEHLLDTARR